MKSKSKIEATIYKTNGKIYAFTVENHGSSFVCAAISMLVLNTINAIDEFIETDFSVDIDEKNAIIHFESNDIFKGVENKELEILLKTLELGFIDTANNYSDDLSLIIEEVQ